MGAKLVTVESLGRRFEDRWVFRGFSLSADYGERIAVIGPNGVGKTTLLRVLVTLLTPSEGEVFVEGIALSQRASDARRRIGWAGATDGGFFPRLTGRDNLLCFGALQGIPRRDVKQALQVADRLPTLKAALATPYGVCSSGMRQILHISRALLGAPKLLVLDEPTRSLDAATTVEVRDWLTGLSSELVVIYSSHDADAVSSMSTRVIAMSPQANP